VKRKVIAAFTRPGWANAANCSALATVTVPPPRRQIGPITPATSSSLGTSANSS
jgi:hypothetical protein